MQKGIQNFEKSFSYYLYAEHINCLCVGCKISFPFIISLVKIYLTKRFSRPAQRRTLNYSVDSNSLSAAVFPRFARRAAELSR